jgi:hypothetical protein
VFLFSSFTSRRGLRIYFPQHDEVKKETWKEKISYRKGADKMNIYLQENEKYLLKRDFK